MKKRKTIKIKDCGNRSACPLTNTLDLIGDKWTLIILRDMLFIGKKQFGDFLESPEGISTNILTSRLKKLEECKLISKSPYQDNPLRYEYSMTESGSALKPVIMEIAGWGLKHIEGTRGPSDGELKKMQKQFNRLKTPFQKK